MKKRFRAGRLTKKNFFIRSLFKGLEYTMAAIVPIELAFNRALAKIGWLNDDALMEQDTRKFFITFSIAVYSSLISAGSRATIITEIKSHQALIDAIRASSNKRLKLPQRDVDQEADKLTRKPHGASSTKEKGSPLEADIESCGLFAYKAKAVLKKDRKLMRLSLGLLILSFGFFVNHMVCKLFPEQHTHDDHEHSRRLSQGDLTFSTILHEYSLISAIVIAALSIILDVFRNRTLAAYADRSFEQTGSISSHVFADEFNKVCEISQRSSRSSRTDQTIRSIHSNFFDHHQKSFLRSRGLSQDISRSESPLPRERRKAARIAPAPIETEDNAFSPS